MPETVSWFWCRTHRRAHRLAPRVPLPAGCASLHGQFPTKKAAETRGAELDAQPVDWNVEAPR